LINVDFAWIPVFAIALQLTKRHMLLFCHSGLDPESTTSSRQYGFWMPDQACPQLDWGSGMTDRKEASFRISTLCFAGITGCGQSGESNGF
jgi:hypothetical protein